MTDSCTAEFDATVDELADVSLRTAQRSQAFRSWRMQSIVISGIAAGAMAAVVVSVLSSAPWLACVVIGAAAGGVTTLFYAQVHESHMRGRCRRLWVEQLGSRTSVHCEIEPRPAGLHVRQDGLDMTFTWDGSETTEESTGDVVINFRQGLVIVRRRGFSSPEDQRRFVDRTREFSAAALRGK